MFDSVGDDPTWGGIEEEENGGGHANGGGGSRGGGRRGGGRRGGGGSGPGQGQPAPEADPNKPGASFFERIARGNNLTKMGSSSQPRAWRCRWPRRRARASTAPRCRWWARSR